MASLKTVWAVVFERFWAGKVALHLYLCKNRVKYHMGNKAALNMTIPTKGLLHERFQSFTNKPISFATICYLHSPHLKMLFYLK